MNGVHDMGGMHGFGPIEPESDEPVFHEPWEARTLALTLAMGSWGKWTIDAARHARELIAPADYLRMSYYERWVEALVQLMIAHGLVSAEEMRPPHATRGAARETPAVRAAQVEPQLRRGTVYERPVAVAPRFAPGAPVRTRNLHPIGHTRLPRYARGKRGAIARDHGVFVFADSNAHGRGEKPQHLYSVRFAAHDLWGEEAGAGDAVYLDLWEDHLEPA